MLLKNNYNYAKFFMYDVIIEYNNFFILNINNFEQLNIFDSFFGLLNIFHFKNFSNFFNLDYIFNLFSGNNYFCFIDKFNFYGYLLNIFNNISKFDLLGICLNNNFFNLNNNFFNLSNKFFYNIYFLIYKEKFNKLIFKRNLN